MAERLYSENWNRVTDLRPRLQDHVEIHRHIYRGQIWYILYDPTTGRSSRLAPEAYYAISLLDGSRSVDEVWRAANDRLGNEAPTQDELITLLGQLYGSDLLMADAQPDVDELVRRGQRHEMQKVKQRLWSPLSIRIPVLDPDRFVSRTVGLFAPFIGPFGLLLWLAAMITGLSLAAVNWDELTGNLTDRVFSSSNLALIWLIYPVVKGLHELGHAYAVKKWGGDVHEMGIMLIALMPIPYVDASAASAFRSKRQRMAVGAMGMFVETFLAALAMAFWAFAEPGLGRTIAYNVILIAGVSSLFFNGNPLLRFDAYYILADWVEIPNLGGRSNKYYGYLVQRYLFGMRDAVNPVSAPGEARWFLFYGLGAFIYRMFVMVGIILFVAGRFFFVGVILAVWAGVTQIVVPLWKMAKFVATSQLVGRHRRRAIAISLGAIAAGFIGLFVVPAPDATRAEGVVWAPERSIVRAAVSGFVERLDATSGAEVAAGQPLIRSDDPLLASRVRVLEARRAEYQLRLASAVTTGPRETAIIREQIRAVDADLADAMRKREALTVVSPANGTFVVPMGDDIIGRHLNQGDVTGYVLDAQHVQLKVITDQNAIGKIRAKTNQIWIWPADRAATAPIAARIVRDIPGGTQSLPNPALGTSGGGQIPVDPSDPDGVATIDRVFELDLEFDAEDYDVVGRRVHVLFTHDNTPLGFQIARSIRQLFLDRFDV